MAALACITLLMAIGSEGAIIEFFLLPLKLAGLVLKYVMLGFKYVMGKLVDKIRDAFKNANSNYNEYMFRCYLGAQGGAND